MKIWIEKLRQRVADASPRLSNASYLPQGLIWFSLFVVFTDLCVIFFLNRLLYWIWKSRAESSLPFLKTILDAGVWVYALAGLGYLLVIWFILTIFTRSAALILWAPVTFVHLSHTLRWLAEVLFYNDTLPLPDNVVTYTNAITALICGLILAAVLLKPVREVSSRRFVRYLKPGFALFWVCGLIGLVIFQAVSHHSGWQPISPEHSPGKRANSNIVFDSQREVFVMFGGLSNHLGGSFEFANDTWEWDGEDWKEIDTANSPSPRSNFSMAYDEKRGQVVLFGGNNKDEITVLHDTWVYDGQDWTLKQSSYTPQSRRDAQMFYDPESEKVILSGGIYRSKPDEDFKKYQDIWEWDGTKWSAARASNLKVMITRQSTAWDAFNSRLLVYNYDRMLEWGNGKWAPLDFDTFPGKRWGAQIAANPNDGKVLLFGGGSPKEEREDTWVLEGTYVARVAPGDETQRTGRLSPFL